MHVFPMHTHIAGYASVDTACRFWKHLGATAEKETTWLQFLLCWAYGHRHAKIYIIIFAYTHIHASCDVIHVVSCSIGSAVYAKLHLTIQSYEDELKANAYIRMFYLSICLSIYIYIYIYYIYIYEHNIYTHIHAHTYMLEGQLIWCCGHAGSSTRMRSRQIRTITTRGLIMFA